jgi:hypothetical protein
MGLTSNDRNCLSDDKWYRAFLYLLPYNNPRYNPLNGLQWTILYKSILGPQNLITIDIVL